MEKTLAGLLALILVAGAMPANVGGFLTAKSAEFAVVSTVIPNITFTGGKNATSSGSLIEGTLIYTANEGYSFAPFDDIVHGGITVKRVNDTTVEVTGFPEVNIGIIIPDAILTTSELYDFSDDSQFADWTFIDADGDGYTWASSSDIESIAYVEGAVVVHNHSSEDQDYSSISVISYSNVFGALTSCDDWAILPAGVVNRSGIFSLWAMNQDNYYDSAVVYVAQKDDVNLNNLDISKWIALDGEIKPTPKLTWTKYSFDLSAYSGQEIYLALRHQNSDQFVMYVDDIELPFATKPNITPTLTIDNWTYDEEPNEPSLSGNTGNGAVTYTYKVKGADDSTYLPDVPTAAGDYTLKATIAETDDYNGAEITVDFSIDKINVTPVVSISNCIYGKTPKAPKVEGNTGNGDVSYQYKVKGADDSTYVTDVPTDIGEYTVKATISETDKYYGAEATADFSIVKANISPTVSISNWNSGGTPSTPTVEGNTGNGTVTYQYKVKGAADSTYSDSVPETAGEYTVKATIDATTNYNTATATANFKIINTEGFVSVDSIPVQEGKIFAGLYTDNTCTAAYKGDGMAYAKFVDADRYLKASISGTDLATGQTKTNLTFTTFTDSNKYKNIYFVMNNGGKIKTVQANRLIKVGNEYKAEYMLKGIIVTPYWTTLDGTVVQGTPAVYGVVPV